MEKMLTKFIVVLGMAHSGTTIFTKILSQCPSITLFKEGGEAHKLENNLLLRHQSSDAAIIKGLLERCQQPYLLMKRPWMEQFSDFFVEHFPNAYYFILLKDFEQQVKSWGKTTSLVEPELRNDLVVQKVRYARCRRYAEEFPLPHTLVNYNDLLHNAPEVFGKISKDLGLGFTFSFTEIEFHRLIL